MVFKKRNAVAQLERFKKARRAKVEKVHEETEAIAGMTVRQDVWYPNEDAGPSIQRMHETTETTDELESTVHIDIKQEPLEVEQDEQIMLLQDEMKVEVDLLDPKDTCPAEEELDPFGQATYQKLFQENGENQQDRIRCQFCLKQFRDGSDRGTISQSKVEFVLGLRGLEIPGTQPACCEDCRKMFELFYEFKRSCLVALERSAELLIRTGPQAKMMESKSKTKDVQQKEEFDGLEEVSNQKSLEIQRPSIEARSTKLKQKQAVEKPSFECEICMEKFSYGSVLKKHRLNHFSISPKKTVTKSNASGKSTGLSADLDIPAPELDLLTTAMEDEEQKETYCDRCRKWFSSKTIYTHHKPFCIKFRVRKKPEPSSFVCSLCPQKFRCQQNLTLHINKHNGVRTVPCRQEGCTKKFFDSRTRCMHEKCCGQDGQLICSVCGSLFRSEGGLRSHLQSHGEPRFSCDLCNKAFHRKDKLTKHAATHSEERKFQCKVCGKRFKSYEANRVHQRIHTQEKPYACYICDQRFMYNCLLKTHLQKGHEPEQLVGSV